MSGVRDRGRPLLALASNSVWNVLNFRLSLLRTLRDQGCRIAVLAPAGEGARQLESEGAAFLETPMRANGASPVADARLVVRYARVLAAIRPAALLGFTPKPNIYGSIAAARLGVPVINNVTGLGTAFIQGKLLESVATNLYRVALRRSSAVFFHNEDDLELFERRRMVRSGQGEVIPGSGVDTERFSASPLPSADGEIRFLFVGRLLREKGIGEFVAAARAVRSSHPNARFRILGGLAEDPRAVSRAELQAWVDEGLVEYLGTSDDVREAIAWCDCVVLPSYREGLPRVLLEGGAMGRPSIAADVPGSRRAVVHGDTGLLCQVRSSEAVAGAMLEMARMPASARQRMGNRARARMVEQFGESRVAEAYMRALRNIGAVGGA